MTLHDLGIFTSGFLACAAVQTATYAFIVWKSRRKHRKPSQLRGPDGRFVSPKTPMNRQLAEENRLYRVSKMEAANNK